MKTVVDKSLQLVACRFVSKQLLKLSGHLRGAKTARDTEDIHQARVACRRLRSALTVFWDCFDSDKMGGWNKCLKKLLRALGAARDLDVQIEFLEQVAASAAQESKGNRPGVKRMMLRWQQNREAVQAGVIKAIEKVEKSHVLTSIHLNVEHVLFEQRHADVPAMGRAIRERACGQIEQRRADLLSRRHCLEEADDMVGHHAMRIAAKKLRYTMEICDTAVEGRLKTPTKKIKAIQTILGDLHDCDVWQTDVQAFMTREKQRTQDFYGTTRPFSRILPGLECLSRERKHRRMELLERAREYLAELEQEGFWDSFLDVLTDDPQAERNVPQDGGRDESAEQEQLQTEGGNSV